MVVNKTVSLDFCPAELHFFPWGPPVPCCADVAHVIHLCIYLVLPVLQQRCPPFNTTKWRCCAVLAVYYVVAGCLPYTVAQLPNPKCGRRWNWILYECSIISALANASCNLNVSALNGTTAVTPCYMYLRLCLCLCLTYLTLNKLWFWQFPNVALSLCYYYVLNVRDEIMHLFAQITSLEMTENLHVVCIPCSAS